MKNLLLLTILLLPYLVNAQTGTKQITLEDLWKTNTFRIKDVPGFNAMKDGKHFTKLESDSAGQYIRVYELEKGTLVSTLFDNAKAKIGNADHKFDEYRFSNDEKKLLLLASSENIYRRSVLYHTYVAELTSGKIIEVDTAKILHPTFSPDGKWIAYVKNNDLWIQDLQTQIPRKITNDGLKNHIINGNCDWVYEEEFGFSRAFEWSPDGKYIAWYRFDESAVPEYTIAKYNGLYPEQYTYKYPKAGEANSLVQINTLNIATGAVTHCDAGAVTDQYIPRIKWTNDPSTLCIYRLNRHQNKLELLFCDAGTGKSHVIYTEENKCYVEISDEINFLPDGRSMILRSEKDGVSRLYHYDWTTGKSTCLTPGNTEVDGLTGVDVQKKLVYYTATGITPMERSFCVTDWAGKMQKNLTPERGYHSITKCDGFHFFVDKHSTLNHVPVYYLRDATGKIVRTLEDNYDLENKMKEYQLGKTAFLKLPGSTDTLNGWIITPPGFDSNKKYPVLMYQYSGPGSQEVADRFPLGNYFWHQMLAEKGYVVVCVDGTGTGYRGEAFKKKTYLQLGKYESEDQIAAARYLGTLSWVDKSRIGIWGWSYGGFMSSNCILKGNDVFKTAIAVAPVTNWRYYDNIYTERYMRTPAENVAGYDENAPDKIADKLKGKFLFIHGTADDNVHFQNSVMLASALIKAGKDYDSEYYPDKAHGISGLGTRLHLYRRMTDFILKNL